MRLLIKLIRNKTMKFDNLKQMQQVAILADLAGILEWRQRPRKTPYIRPEEVTEFNTKQYGLTSPILNLRHSSFMDLHVSKNRRLGITYNSENNKARFRPYMVGNENYDDYIGIGRYGIGCDINLKHNDIEAGLESIIKFLTSFEKLLKVEPENSNVFRLLKNQITKARDLDEELFDRMYVNHELACKLKMVYDTISNQPYVSYHPIYDKPEDDETTDYRINVRVGGKHEIYHIPSTNNPKALILVVDLGDWGDDMVTVSYYVREDEVPKRIGSFIPEMHECPREFTKALQFKIKDLVMKSDERDAVLSKLNRYLDELDKIIELPDKTLIELDRQFNGE